MHYAQEWLRNQTSIAEIEASREAPKEEWTPQFKKLWSLFLSQMVEGDEIWSFSTSSESWQKLRGRGGYAIVRQGKVVDAIVTRMN